MKNILDKIKKITNNKIVKTAFRIIEYFFFIMMGIYIAFIAFQRISNNAAIGGYRVFTVATGSMKPVYEVGDVLVVKTVESDTLKVGDYVTYYGNSGDMKDKIITHRIIRIDNNEITTKGTANTAEDPSITYDQIYGKVVHKLALITMISNIVRNQYGFFFFVFAPLVIIVFMEIVDIFKEGKTKKINEK